MALQYESMRSGLGGGGGGGEVGGGGGSVVLVLSCIIYVHHLFAMEAGVTLVSIFASLSSLA